MRGRLGPRTIALIALLIVTPTLAGCFGGASAGTAMSNRDEADSRAQDWSSNAELIGVVGFEGATPESQPDEAGPSEDMCEGDYFEDAKDDDDVGNGQAAFWAFIYQAPDKDQDHIVVLGGDGSSIAECDVPSESDLSPVGQWEIDSDEAVEAAAEANDQIGDAGSGDKGLMMMLINSEDSEQENAVWWIAVVGGSSGSDMGGFVMIDAVTGEVVFNSADFGGMGGSS